MIRIPDTRGKVFVKLFTFSEANITGIVPVFGKFSIITMAVNQNYF